MSAMNVDTDDDSPTSQLFVSVEDGLDKLPTLVVASLFDFKDDDDNDITESVAVAAASNNENCMCSANNNNSTP